jgi:hypothetical protein
VHFGRQYDWIRSIAAAHCLPHGGAPRYAHAQPNRAESTRTRDPRQYARERCTILGIDNCDWADCPITREDNNMKKLITAGLVLSAVFAASGKVHAYVTYPWCIIGDTRGRECIFSSREQCAQDGRNRGFGGQCIQNPFYHGPVVGAAAPVKKRVHGRRRSSGE